MTRTRCPSGRECVNYSADIRSGPDQDGCFGGCARGEDSEMASLRAQLSECTLAREKLEGELGRGFWECDDCGFRMGAEHTDEDGEYSCPCCAETRLEGELAEARAEVERLSRPLTEEMPFLDEAREYIAGMDGPESLYTEEMVEKLLFAADKDFASLKAQIKWLERNSVMKNPAQTSIFDRATAAEAALAEAVKERDELIFELNGHMARLAISWDALWSDEERKLSEAMRALKEKRNA